MKICVDVEGEDMMNDDVHDEKKRGNSVLGIKTRRQFFLNLFNHVYF